MEHHQAKVFDPMLAQRTQARRTLTYARRSSLYRSTAGALDAHKTLQLKTIQPSLPIRDGMLAPARRSDPAHAAVPTPPAIVSSAEPSEPAIVPLKPRVRLRLWRLSLTVPTTQTAILYGMALFVFTVGILVSINGLRTNHQVAAQVKHSQQQTDNTVADTVTPSTAKPSAAAIKNYAVSPNIPKYLDIPKLTIHTRILSEGVTKSGQLQVPWNIYDTGWYNASSQPGQEGATLIDGHSGIDGLHGVFYKLSSLVPGDTIMVTRGDNTQFTYTVVTVRTLNVGDVNMSDMLVSADTNKPGLNLITCAGEQIPGTDQLNERVEVFAVQQ